MTEPHVTFEEIEEGVATFILYKEEGLSESFRYPVDDLPEGVDRDQLDCAYQSEFDDDGEIAALYYDEELTQREHENARSAIEEYYILDLLRCDYVSSAAIGRRQ